MRPTPTTRAAIFLVGDLLIWTASLWGAYLLRFDGAIPSRYAGQIPVLLAILIPFKLAWQTRYRLYQLTWRLVGLADFISIIKANTLALLMAASAALLFRHVEIFNTFPRSVLLLDYILSTCGVAVLRASRRGWQVERERFRTRHQRHDGTNLLIVGAGAAGARIARSIQDSEESRYHPVGFIDDDGAKHGTYIYGLKVLGGREALARVVRDHGVDEVLIAIPSAPPLRLREVIRDVRQTGIQRIKVMPGMHEFLAGRVSLKNIRDVNPEDLLARPPVRIQYDALRTYLKGKRVFVSGAAGSIGSELIRQLARFDVEQVVACDISESGLFELEQEVKNQFPDFPLHAALADVRDGAKVNWLMSTARPHLVFHAAANKHVPMMEREVGESIKTNIFGTLVMGEASLRHNVETFVFISTDKAVNPSSVMGASKRVGELVVQALARRNRTRFLGVRFGNVLGSRGSIIPILQEQIRQGGPVTITHPEMVRYFMSIAEAVLLVLQTPVMTTPGSIFMLDMGEPVRIVDLVHELIRLSGLEVDSDIPIVFSGIRPGEKVQEELVMPQEQIVPTPFEGILGVRSSEQVDEVGLRLVLREMEQLVTAMDNDGARALLEHVAGGPDGHTGVTRPAAGMPRSR
jgi:FlaA1/EpsC-like NDP-sugar epimerase